jgi:predicted RNA-binding protein (virulence factor B family)
MKKLLLLSLFVAGCSDDEKKRDYHLPDVAFQAAELIKEGKDKGIFIKCKGEKEDYYQAVFICPCDCDDWVEVHIYEDHKNQFVYTGEHAEETADKACGL